MSMRKINYIFRFLVGFFFGFQCTVTFIEPISACPMICYPYVCVCKGKCCHILGLFVFVYKEHTCHTWHADFVFGWLYVFACFNVFFCLFFLPSCLFAAPVCDDPCTVLNISQRVQKAAKIKKKAVCKKKKEIEIEEEHAFFEPSTPCLCSSSVQLS